MTTTVAGAAHRLRDTGDRHRSPVLAPVPAGWPAAAELVDRLLRVLGSAEQAVRVLVPAGWHDPGDPDVAVRAEKVIAETALLLLALAPAAR